MLESILLEKQNESMIFDEDILYGPIMQQNNVQPTGFDSTSESAAKRSLYRDTCAARQCR